MSQTAGPDLCRVTIVGPARRLDISVPSDMPFAELLPIVLHHAGADLANKGLAHGGWVLQRLDEAPFDPAGTPAQAGIRDGELLHLRPGMSAFREPTFDDVADVVATGVNEKTDRWRPEFTRRAAIGCAAGALLAGLIPILHAGPPWPVPAGVAGGVTLILLIAAVTFARAVGDSGAGAALGYVALPYAFVGGALAPLRDESLVHLGSSHLLAGFAAVVLVALVAGFATRDGLSNFAGISFAAFLGTIGTAVAFAFDSVHAAGVGAVTVTVALAFTPLIPTIAFRIARVTLPPVPRSAEELRADTLNVDGGQLLRRTQAADRYVTGMAAGIALVGLVAEVPLAFTNGTLGSITCGVAALTLLLRARIFRGRAARLWFVIAGAVGLVLLAVGVALGASELARDLSVVGLLVAGALFTISVGSWLPGNRPSPFWARAGDVLEMFAVIGLVILTPGILGLYGYIRGLAG